MYATMQQQSDEQPQQQQPHEQQPQQQPQHQQGLAQPTVTQAPAKHYSVVYWFDIPSHTSIEDFSTDAGRHFISAIKIAANNARSPIYWGRTVENPDVVLCVISKDVYGSEFRGTKPQAHQEPWRFAASQLLFKVCHSEPKTFHFDFAEQPTAALEAPVTFFACCFFGAGHESLPQRQRFERLMREYNTATQRGTHARPGSQYHYMGWAVQDDVPYTSFDGPQRSGKALYLVSGWPSIEAQQQAHVGKGMEDEARAIVLGGADGWRLVHVRFRKVSPDVMQGS